MTSDTPTILLVCTGNVSRSAAAERLLAERLGASVHVGSAGTNAALDRPFDEKMAHFLPGLDTTDFVTRQLTTELVDEASLILAMTRAHRAYVLDLVPAAVRRTFTLLEFAKWVSVATPAELAGATPGERLTTVLGHIPDLRVRAPRQRSAPVDVRDPFGRDQATYRAVARQIYEAVETIADALEKVPKRAAFDDAF